MRLDERLSYPFGPREAAEVLADEAFHEEVCRRSGSARYAVAVEGAPEGAFAVTISREMTTESLPDFARGFVGATISVSQQETWSAPAADGGRSGAVTVALSGVPLHVDATQELRAGAEGTEHRLTGEVKSTVPFLGSRIEEAAAPILRKALAEQQELARTWLDRA